MKKKQNKKNQVGRNKFGFTLIELLLTMIIIGILVAAVYVVMGNQRQNARMNAVLQTASSVLSVGRDCYFRLKKIDLPNNEKKPTNEICAGSKAPWPEINIGDCYYGNIEDESEDYYIDCPEAQKRVFCGVAPQNVGCKIEDLPQ